VNPYEGLGVLARLRSWAAQVGDVLRGTGPWSDAARWDAAVAAGYRAGVLDERARKS
jgi:hypothetical protein